MTISNYYTLHNGVKIPSIGFGTAETDGETTIRAIHAAVDAGYRHIDTAVAYGNEESVGQGINTCKVPRGELFLTSKLWNDDQGYENTLAAFQATLERLSTSYLDLYLIHWPIAKKYKDEWQQRNLDSWRAMEELYKSGKIRAIGVSNFMPHHLRPLMEKAKISPMVNQIELHPGCHQDETVSFCHSQGIVVEAWSPLMHGGAMGLPVLKKIAEKHKKTPAQICLRWSLQKGILPLPKSVTPERIRQNKDIFDFTLSEQDMEEIDTLKTVGAMGPFPDDAAF